MFSKRRRAASNPPSTAPPSASASLAATKAFVRDRESNASLSNAAAAAALRTHVTTPTPVGETVTKRMIRRSSVSSNGSPRPPPGPLRRQSSSGSMSERSFRASSPARGSPAEPTAPPVPPVPKNIADTGVQRRASSLEPSFRSGPSAPSGRGRGASVDTGEQSMAGRGQRPMNPLANVSEEDTTAAQRSSVNFSRPMSPSIPTPPRQETAPQSAKGWFGGPVVNQEAVQQMATTSRPRTAGGISDYELQNTRQSVQNAADRPVRKHQVSQSVDGGSRLASGSMRAKPSGTAVQSRSFLQPAPRQPPRILDPKSPDAVYDPSSRTFIHRQDAMALHRQMHQEPTPLAPSPQRQTIQREAPSHAQPTRDAALPRLDTTARDRASDPPEPHFDPEPEEHIAEESTDVHLQSPTPANTSRKMENTAPVAEAEPAVSFQSPKLATNQDSSYPRLTPSPTPTSNKNVPDPGRGSLRTGHDRNSSLSPPRSAHFASMTVELTGEKHQPPPRSVSPAKSALKPSPSISRRGSSPTAPNARIVSKGAPSEASDTASEDGLKKKKHVRVSFEETPVVAGTAAYPNTDTPTAPPGLQASRWSPIAEKENEFEDFMKPRAALPVFGSIREKERRPTHDDVAEKVTETVSSTPMSASVGSIGEPLQSSNDHALGNIVAQDFARKQSATNDPLPPEVTSVEGCGYVSDSSQESNMGKHTDALPVSQPPPIPEPKSLTTPLDDKSSTPGSAVERIIEVPHIALLPATPSPYEKAEPIFQSMAIPGRWDEEGSEQDGKTTVASTATPTAQTTIEPPRQPSPEPSEEDESSDDNSSIYSDAYEELTDTEGGFGSIDAMVGSSITPSSSGLMSSKYADKSASEAPASKLRNETTIDVAEPRQNDPESPRAQPQGNMSYTDRQMHAHDVAARVMQSPVTPQPPVVERAVTAEPIHKTSTPPPVSQPSPKPLKSALKKAPVVHAAQPAEPHMRQSMRGPAPRQETSSEPHMRKTMRGGTGLVIRAEPQMRSSMRGGPDPAPRAQPQMRMSMRGADPPRPTSPGLAASRHSVLPQETKAPRGALQKRNIPAAAAAPKPRPQSMPAVKAAPVPTYDSDSDGSASSFQRTRARGNRNQGGRYTMRGSMRNEPAPTMRTAAPAPMSKQIRPISPPASPAPAIRKSMRPSSPTPEPTKSSKFRLRSLSPIGRFRSSKDADAGPPSPIQPKKTAKPTFGKQSKPKAPAPSRAKAPEAASKSRFADSSDEDDDASPRRFQSRFADSDSDDGEDYRLPPDLAPVRGIPRRAGEEDGDSTDLEEEADEEKAITSIVPNDKAGSATKATKDQTNGISNGQGTALSAGSLRDSQHAPALPTFEAAGKGKTKRGFFGLGKKKTVTPQSDAALPAPKTEEVVPEPPAPQNRQPGFPLTPIDEDKDMGTAVTPSPETKKAPKLQRRSTPEWPLPSPPAIGTENRPMSSDGVAPRRPRFQKRESTMSNNTAPFVDAQGRSVSYGKDGKKKKFQGLRRVFGIND